MYDFLGPMIHINIESISPWILFDDGICRDTVMMFTEPPLFEAIEWALK